MLALAGRECCIFSYTDVAPVCFLWAVDVACRLIAFGSPIQHCEWLVNSSSTARRPNAVQIPTMLTLVSIVGVATLSATMLTILNEMWRMWDPFGGGDESIGLDTGDGHGN